MLLQTILRQENSQKKLIKAPEEKGLEINEKYLKVFLLKIISD